MSLAIVTLISAWRYVLGGSGADSYGISFVHSSAFMRSVVPPSWAGLLSAAGGTAVNGYAFPSDSLILLSSWWPNHMICPFALVKLTASMTSKVLTGLEHHLRWFHTIRLSPYKMADGHLLVDPTVPYMWTPGSCRLLGAVC